MNTLVTVFGASGFLGRHMVHALAQAGWRVRAVCRHPNLANYLLPAGMTGQVQIFRGNVRKEECLRQALDGAGAVVNLVGVLFGHGNQSFEALHVDAAAAIARNAANAGIRSLVHISAIGANPTAEARYAQSKGEGERRVREAFPEATILRPSLIFGPEDMFFNTFAWMARYAPVLPAIGGGKARFQPIYVGDVAAAAVSALAREAARGQTYELGGPTVYSFRELLRFVLRTTGRKRLILPIPFSAAGLLAFGLQLPCYVLPLQPLMTVDAVRMLKRDTIVGADTATLADLEITPRRLEDIVPTYLWRFRQRGQFDQPATAQGI